MDELSKFPASVWLLRELILSQNKYRGIPGTAEFFHGKYRGRNFEYRTSLVFGSAVKYLLNSLCGRKGGIYVNIRKRNWKSVKRLSRMFGF